MTGKELVAFARTKLNTPYVYGAKGQVLTKEMYNTLKKAYGDMVWDSDSKKIGKVCVDCSGLISWATGKILGSAKLFELAIKKEPITTITTAPIGALVWKKGHVGVYTGMKNNVPHYIAADGSAYGVREVPLSENNFTHWLLMDYFDYEEAPIPAKKSGNIVIDDKPYDVKLILENGENYVRLRDLSAILGFDLSNNGNLPIIKT